MQNHPERHPDLVEVLSHYKWLLVYIAIVVTASLVAHIIWN